MNKLFIRIFTVLLVAVLHQNVASATIIGISWFSENSQSQVFKINELTGETELVGDTGTNQLNALSEDGHGGLLAGEGERIYSLDPITGLVTSFDTINFPNTGFSGEPQFRSLAVAADGTLYAMTKRIIGSAVQELWSIDLTTATATLIATEISYSPQALTIAPDGRLLSYSWSGGAVGTNDAGLISFDPLTGEFTDDDADIRNALVDFSSLTNCATSVYGTCISENDILARRI